MKWSLETNIVIWNGSLLIWVLFSRINMEMTFSGGGRFCLAANYDEYQLLFMICRKILMHHSVIFKLVPITLQSLKSHMLWICVGGTVYAALIMQTCIWKTNGLCVFWKWFKRSGAGIAGSIHGKNKEDVAVEWLAIQLAFFLFLLFFHSANRFPLKNNFLLRGSASCFADTNTCKTRSEKRPISQL